jgi:peptidoglycan/xylan/chitin deacetylase (PgdA/CDA1 family)
LELIAAGMSVGSHGMRHLDWARTNARDLTEEIFAGKSALEDICGCKIDEVAIPFGSYNRRVIEKLRELGPRCVYTTDGGYARVDDWLKPRNSFDRTWQKHDLISELDNEHSFSRRVRRLISQRYKLMR